MGENCAIIFEFYGCDASFARFGCEKLEQIARELTKSMLSNIKYINITLESRVHDEIFELRFFERQVAYMVYIHVFVRVYGDNGLNTTLTN